MEYTPRELARQLQCSLKAIHRLIRAGCPARADGNGRYWIVGDELATWYTDAVQSNKQPMEPDEAYCLKCQKPVKLRSSTLKKLRFNLYIEYGVCPICRTTVCRIRTAAEVDA
jgi:hypothetical protein